MQDKDAIEHEFMSDPEVFAELFNRNVFKADVIKPENLQDLDPYFSIVNSGSGSEKPVATRRERDLLKKAVIKTDGELNYCCVMLGLENQSYRDTSMCLRVMEYDYLTYKRQENEWKAKKRRERQAKGLSVTDEISIDEDEEFQYIPVITLVLNLTGRNWTPHKTLYEKMNSRALEAFKGGIKPFNYGYVVLNPAELTLEEVLQYKSPIKPVLGVLSKAENTREAIEFVENNQNFFLGALKKFENYYKIVFRKNIINKIEETNQKIKEDATLEQMIQYSVNAKDSMMAAGAERNKKESAKRFLLMQLDPESIAIGLDMSVEEVLEIQKMLLSSED